MKPARNPPESKPFEGKSSDTKRSRRGIRQRLQEPPDRVRPEAAPSTGMAGPRGWLVLLAGWLLPQVLLLGPALVGRTVNLPLDLLATPHLYLPNTPEYARIVPVHGIGLLDLVILYPGPREFAAGELRAGRLPLWQPANFAGAPFAVWPKYSPFELIHYIAPQPVTLAWMSLLEAVTCGLGMWLFLRLALRLSYWPAAVASWCTPLTGFMTLWQGHFLVGPVCWLPWLLFLAHRSVKKPWGWSNVGLAAVTALLILCGGLDVGGLVLVTTGLYALWLLAADDLRHKRWRRACSAGGGITAAWLLGFILATAYWLPLQEYFRTGARLQARVSGAQERPPVGVSALPAVVLPDVYGSDRADSLPLVESGNRLEGSAGACAGLLALFWLAPLAWFHSRFRQECLFFTLLAVAGLGWTLNLPGFEQVLSTRPFNMLSYNRWVFATSDAVLVLAAVGLDYLLTCPLKFHRRFLVPVLVTGAFGVWCLFRFLELPEPLQSEMEAAIRQGRAGGLSLDRLRAAQRSFTLCYAIGAALSLAAEIGWLAAGKSTRSRVWCRWAIVALLPAQLIWFAWLERRQADRALYFPKVAALAKLAALPPGRIWGVDCLPPNLNEMCRLEDVRGYDAVDPLHFVRLFELARDPRSPATPYAVTQEAVPTLVTSNGRVKLHPVADLLNVRYLVLRTPPPGDFPIVVHDSDYWVVENRDALPRAFVPRSVQVVADDHQALATMQKSVFNPRETVLMTADPKVGDRIEGTAAIHYESPTRATVIADLRTDGIVVISDLWDAGWQAELDGKACPIHRVDTALRGLRVPSGKHTIELTYAPASVRHGFQMTAAGGVLLLFWSALLFAKRHRASRRSMASTS